MIHTGQHYSYNLDKIFFEELKLPKSDYNLEIGQISKTQGEQTGRMIIEIEKALKKDEKGDVIVQGDTNTVLAGALTAIKLNYPVAHIEAGLRSRDYRMPEEYNRIITDHCSTYLFPPTEKAEKNLIEENVPKEKIHVVGNTIVDATLQNIEIAESKKEWIEKFPDEYILLTMHRQENVDNKKELTSILEGIRKVKKELDLPIIYPMHPRTKKRIKEFGLEEQLKELEVIDPVGYLEFLLMEKNAKVILTDSGGVQEESCILKTPCVTIRKSTERQETVEIGSNILAGTNADDILNATIQMIEKKKRLEQPIRRRNSKQKNN